MDTFEYDFLMDSGYEINEINREFQLHEENMMEHSVSNFPDNEVINSFSELAERSSNQNGLYMECSLETGDWYSVTPSDINEMNRELEALNSGEHHSSHNKSLGFVEKFAHQRGQYVDFPWIDEDCEEQSWVSVWLYTRPIGGRSDKSTSRRHWAVIFQWQGKSATYEGMNVNGYLQPKWHEGTPTDVEDITQNNGWIVGNYLGEHYLSPKEVNEAAKYNQANRYKYLAGHTNCHYWAKVFAESLGLDVPQTCAEAEPFNAMLASMYKSAS